MVRFESGFLIGRGTFGKAYVFVATGACEPQIGPRKFPGTNQGEFRAPNKYKWWWLKECFWICS